MATARLKMVTTSLWVSRRSVFLTSLPLQRSVAPLRRKSVVDLGRNDVVLTEGRGRDFKLRKGSLGSQALFAANDLAFVKLAAIRIWLLKTQKSPVSQGDRAVSSVQKSDQPRVRERIMKLSQVYSGTCHHRYWSER